jgi:hypothetical protein
MLRSEITSLLGINLYQKKRAALLPMTKNDSVRRVAISSKAAAALSNLAE